MDKIDYITNEFYILFPEETVSLAICLDGLAKGDHLYVHAAKMPSTGSSASNFFEILTNFGTDAHGSRPHIEMVTKKINLATDRLAWEHEIYNIRRIHAFTLSHFKNYSDPERFVLSFFIILFSLNLKVFSSSGTPYWTRSIHYLWPLWRQMPKPLRMP
jgi:hypothetical protein